MAEELDAGAFEPMEGRGDEQNQAPGAESEGPAAALQTQSSREEQSRLQVLQPQEETTAEEQQQQQQLESGVKMALHQCEPDLQKNQIGGPDLFGYVGIEAVLDQIKNKTVKAGFEFNLMVVGKLRDSRTGPLLLQHLQLSRCSWSLHRSIGPVRTAFTSFTHTILPDVLHHLGFGLLVQQCFGNTRQYLEATGREQGHLG